MIKLQDTKDMINPSCREDKIFYHHVDHYLRNYNLLREEFIEVKWTIVNNINEKLSDINLAWDVYDNPKSYCLSVVSQFNRQYIGVKGRIIRRILPIFLFIVILVILIISPNGISQLFSSNNAGIKLNAVFFWLVFLSIANFIIPIVDRDKNLFIRKPNLKPYSWFVSIIYIIFLLNIQNLMRNDSTQIWIHPMILFILLIGLSVYFVINRKMLMY